ncbi:MAG TPA: DUF58 domain-containing protein, partial [Chthoniobacterales bacterium]|nr:DUF58 domain-containing protein [Chthoniobacterales bacterium]
AAKQVVAGVLPGLQASRQPGLSQEFSQYRAYMPGDEPQQIDWKLFARSDRYYIRESEIETAVTVRIILDATGSMQHEDTAGRGAGIRKFDVARVLAAAFAYLAQTQGDPVGLHAISGGSIESLQPGQRRQPFERILHALENLEPAGSWPDKPRTLTGGMASRNSSAPSPAGTTRELSVILTDGFEHTTEIREALAALRSRHHELLFVHLLGRDEIEFPFSGPVRFEDWETGEVFETDASTARAAWLENLERSLDEWRRGWDTKRFDYLQIRTDEPLDRALRAYLLRRMRR